MEPLRLTRQQKWQARKLARSCWIRSGGDSSVAKAMFEAEAADVGIDPITIIAAIYYALCLWMRWKEHKERVPKALPERGEPYFAEEDMQITTGQQLYAKIVTDFRPPADANQFSFFGAVVDAIQGALKSFVGAKADAMKAVKDFWDNVIVPYDIPKLNNFIESRLEKMAEPIVMDMAEKLLDSLGLQ